MKTKVSLYKSKICLIIAITMLFGSSVYAIDWYEEFKTKYPDDLATLPYLAWYESYIMRAYISMYRASVARGEPQFEQQMWLDRLVNHCDYVVGSPGLMGEEYLVYAGHGYTPIARAVKLFFKDDSLYTYYNTEANNYLNYIETEIIPHWRDYPFWEDPHNWYLSYGCLLMNLHQITRLPYYEPPYYQTPDPSLSDYYYETVTEMATNHFQDFGEWEYTGTNWKWGNVQYPRKGLCYCPSPLDAYLWRYMDYSDLLYFRGYAEPGEHQGVQIPEPVGENEWYYIEVLCESDSIRVNMYDSTGVNLLFAESAPWNPISTDSDFFMGRRIDSPYSTYLEGIMDEVKIMQGDSLVSWWPLEGDAGDISGNGHNGTIYGTPEWVEGRVGQAMKFDYDYIIVPHHPDLDNYTRIELWIKFTECSPKYYNYILGKGEGFPDSIGYNLYTYAYKRPEDVGHANLDIEFVIKSSHDYMFASAYPAEMLERFCNSFTEVVWSNTDPTHPTFRSHLDPGYSDGTDHTMRWLWFYEFDPVIGDLVSNYYEDHEATHWMTEALANLACWQAGLFEDEYEDYTLAEEEKWVQGSAIGIDSLQNYPNPFNPETTISFFIPQNSEVDISVYNIKGQKIKTITNENFQRGYHKVFWNGKDENDRPVSSGIYFYKMETDNYSEIKKCILLK